MLRLQADPAQKRGARFQRLQGDVAIASRRGFEPQRRPARALREHDGRRFLQHGVLRSTVRALRALARHRLKLTQGRNRFFEEVR